MAEKIYKIAKGVAITSKGIVLDEGTVVTAANFASEENFKSLIAAKKIVESDAEKKAEDKTDAEKKDADDKTKQPSGDGGNAKK